MGNNAQMLVEERRLFLIEQSAEE